MNYKLGDSVRIISSGQTGHICDVSVRAGKDIYIVELDSIRELDTLPESCDKGIWDYLITVEYVDIEPYARAKEAYSSI